MRSKVSKWFETKVAYDKLSDDGSTIKAKESYVVEANTFGGAENKITEEMEAYICGEFKVVDCIREARYREVFFSDNAEDDKWYKAKLQFITFDENTEKEKKTAVFYLVQAADFAAAHRHIREVMDKTMIDYEVDTVAETKFMEVFEREIG
jgi:hypothetical protein